MVFEGADFPNIGEVFGESLEMKDGDGGEGWLERVAEEGGERNGGGGGVGADKGSDRIKGEA